MAKPILIPRWGELVDGTPATNLNEPTSGLKDTGYAVNAIPTSSALNWIFRAIYAWIKWIDGEITDGVDLTPGANWTPLTGFPHMHRVRRSGGVAALSIKLTAAAGATADSLFTVPAGYVPLEMAQLTGVFQDSSAGASYLAVVTIDTATGVAQLYLHDNGTALVAPPAIGAGDTIVVSGAYPL